MKKDIKKELVEKKRIVAEAYHIDEMAVELLATILPFPIQEKIPLCQAIDAACHGYRYMYDSDMGVCNGFLWLYQLCSEGFISVRYDENRSSTHDDTMYVKFDYEKINSLYDIM